MQDWKFDEHRRGRCSLTLKRKLSSKTRCLAERTSLGLSVNWREGVLRAVQ
jgi:hypothetical protein